MKLEAGFLPPLIALEANLILGIFLLRIARGRTFHRLVAGLALAVAAWCAGAVGFFILPGTAGDVSLRAGFAGAAAASLLYRLLCRSEAGLPLPRGMKARLALALCSILIIVNLELVLPPDLAYYFSVVQALAAAGYFAGLYLLGWADLRLRLEAVPREREAWSLFLAAAVPFVAALFYGLAAARLSGLAQFNEMLPVLLGAEIVLFLAARSGRIEVGELLSRTLVYLVYTVLIMSAAAAALIIGGKLFGYRPGAFVLLSLGAFSLISAAAFGALRPGIEKWISRALFPNRAEYERRLAAYESELTSARERLIEAERLARLGELGARVAHEIKNPLGPIRGYAEMLIDASSRGPVSPELLVKALNIIREESDKIDARVKNLLDLTRRENAVRSPTGLHPLLEKTIALFEAAPGLEVIADFRASHPILDLDPAKFQSAVYNLLLNAAEAINGKGRITVRTGEGEGAVFLEVIDTGPGIPGDLLPRVFEPFHKNKPGGAGLGLAIVKSATEAHGFSVTAANRPEGGAVFTIIMPKSGKNEDRGGG